MPLLGNSLPGTWRPFLRNSPWNTPIAPDAATHPDSALILDYMRTKAAHLAMSREYTIPIHVVDHRDMTRVRIKSERIFDFYDRNFSGISDDGVPWTPEMWAEQTVDGHICIVDPRAHYAWEMSRFKPGNPPTCTTLNHWNLRLYGYGHHYQGQRWTARGGRGSGFPEIAGLMRREEIDAGAIEHALVFTFPDCRLADDGSKVFIYPPACRSDGQSIGRKYPIQGMLFQLLDWDKTNLSPEARIVAYTLWKYGMRLGDRGGAWKIQSQLLAKTTDAQIMAWRGLYEAVEKIGLENWRIVQTGPATVKKG